MPPSVRVAGAWPDPRAYTAQYWTVSWIDVEIGQLFLGGLAAARAGRVEEAESLLSATLWSDGDAAARINGVGAGISSARRRSR